MGDSVSTTDRVDAPARATVAGWKGIAAYFGRDERTVMRWAAERGLPVRRMPGQKRASVYALPDELAAWLVAASPAPVAEVPSPATVAPPAAPPPVATPRRWRATTVVAAVAAVSVVALAVGGLTATRPALSTPPARAPAAEAAYLRARYDLAQRTPASLQRAVGEFDTAIAAEPRTARNYAGLGETFLLLRQYGHMPDAEAYARAREAADAAVALDDTLPAAHRVLAFAAFWGADDIPTARREFARAVALAPNDPQTRHWYATALMANGEAVSALAQIGIARRLDPDSTSIMADTGLLTAIAGRETEGVALLHDVIAVHPDAASPHKYLADLAIVRGDDATFVAEAARAAALRHDADAAATVAAARDGLVRGGRPGLLAALFEHDMAVGAPGRHAYHLAQIAALQGNRPLTLRLLAEAEAAKDPALALLPGDINFFSLRGDPAFAALARRPTLQPDNTPTS